MEQEKKERQNSETEEIYKKSQESQQPTIAISREISKVQKGKQP